MEESMQIRLELEQWLRIFDNQDLYLLLDFINNKAEFYKNESLRLFRDSKCDEGKVALAKHDALTGVLPAIRQRMKTIKEELNGNNK